MKKLLSVISDSKRRWWVGSFYCKCCCNNIVITLKGFFMKLLYFSTCEIVLNGVEQKNEEGKY